jgi:cephalosporin-C deacetylase-like acetyl esterase
MFFSVFSRAQEVNCDESKVPFFTLPDVLTCSDGRKVTTVREWEQVRRPELMEMFASQMYGRTPEDRIAVTYETLTENPNAMCGKATTRQVKFRFGNGQKTVEAILLLVIPNHVKGKVPVFVGYNYKGNHSTTLEPGIFFPPSFHLIKKAGDPDWAEGCQSNRWWYDRILGKGYAVATMCYHDIFPDDSEMENRKDHSIVSLFPGYRPDSAAPDEWQAIGAWAWGSSRIVDYLETQDRFDPDRIVLVGHSRQGKAALWAGAQDKRFRVVISNNSGCGGAALSKRIYGETVAQVSSIQPPWFCPAFHTLYAGNESNLPFDQHELIALMAPRPVYVASAAEDCWADPKGEFLSAFHAGPVYELYGLSGLGTDVQPGLNQPVMNDIGYHVRTGKHDVTNYDWERFIDFVDRYFSRINGFNYDESKVPPFTLPDVLTCSSGRKVTTVREWERVRRPELMEMFASQMYGRTPEGRIAVTYETLTENPNAMNGKATTRQVKFRFGNGQKTLEAILLLVIPNHVKGKVPVFVGYNYEGNHTTTTEPEIFFPPSLHLIREAGDPCWIRGYEANRWSYDRILDRGYAVATMCYHDIYPDKVGMKDQKEHSIVSLFPGYRPDSVVPDGWQAIGAWAWGSSRIVDYLETQDRLDADKVVIMGHSRQGKAALWAGAQDRRFRVVISNNSGCGGAALSRRIFGETVAQVTSRSPWFCPAFRKLYAGNESNLPFDQHELIALMAPRPVYVASASEDGWADPKGEFLSAFHAGPVYELYELSGLGTDVQPGPEQPVMNGIGYHIRTGKHGVTEYDWERFMDFADRHLFKNSKIQ